MKDSRSRFPVYSKLLKLYPASYRCDYEQEILQTTADMLDDASSKTSKLAVWIRIVADLPIDISRQQLQYVGGVMHNETPQYIKRSSAAASVLLAPFIVILIANGLDKVLHNDTLYGSWLWSMPTLRIWLIWLPGLAFLIALASYVTYVFTSSENNKKDGRVKRMFDIKHSWPIMTPALFAVSIFFIAIFHDSGQCWLRQTPSYLFTHANQTRQCTTANMVPPRNLL